MEWIHKCPTSVWVFPFPRKESFNLNRKKKAPKKRTRFGSNFPPEWATISSRSISRDYMIRPTFFARESCSGQKFLSRKKLSGKYCSIFASKISPATGIMFYIYSHFFTFLLFPKLHRHLCYGAYSCNHTLTHILILRFLLYFNFVLCTSTIVRSVCLP